MFFHQIIIWDFLRLQPLHIRFKCSSQIWKNCFFGKFHWVLPLFWPTFPYINSLMSLGTMVMKEVVEFVFVNHVHLASLCKSTPCIISPCGDVPNHTISQAFAWYVHIKIILWSHILARDTRNSTHGYITLQSIFLKISRIKVPISWSISHGRPW
jgi:hypothetical protein